KLYVNGVLRETIGAITLGTGTTANMVIGGTGEGTGGDNDPYKGLLDDVRLYSGAQTQAEIQTDMNTPAGVPDSEPPTVSLTAPAAGTVTGSAVSVSADASDNIVVMGVQFKLDGADLGAEDTTAPYSMAWNTTATTDGSHTLTAVARDASGNSTTSTGVIVTVSNPPALTITQPTNGSTVSGSTVVVSYTTSGNLSEVSHAHFILDGRMLMDLTLDGTYQFNSVVAGSHVLDGFLVRADHTKILGTDSPTVNFTTTAPDTVPANSLVAAYSFDEGSGTTTADVSGGGNPGTLTNSPVWLTGKHGSALFFSATDDGNDSNDPKVVVGRTLNIPNLPFTFSAWVNPASFADWRAIISKRDASSASNMRLDVGLSSGTGRVYVSTGSMFRSFLYSPPLSAWTHLAVVAESGGTKLYVNGVLRETIGGITLGTGINANVAIGGTGEGSGGDNDPYRGLLDDLRLYNRAQTATEIAADMNVSAGNSGTQPPSLTITQPSGGSTVSGTTVDVSYTTAGDMTGVDHVHFTLDSDPTVMDLTLDGSYQFTGVSAGSHVLNAYLVNQDHVMIPGTAAAPVSFTTTVADTIPPTLSITSPAAASTLSGTVAVAVNASDNTGVVGVQLRVGAVNITPEDTSAPFSIPLNTTSFANGTYVLTAVARDAAGNQTTSAGVSVTFSNVNPNDPSAVGQWAGLTAWPNVAVHLTLMSNGNLLTWDDHTNDAGSNVYNPTTNSFTPAAYNSANLFCAGHTALADGRILVNGGHIAAYVGIPGTVLFTPSTGTWTPVTPMTYGRWYPTTITLPDARVLTVSGAINCPECKYPGGPDAGIAEIPEIYNPANNTWSLMPTASKNFPIYPHLFVLPDGRVIATSTQEDPIPTSVLDMNTQTWSTVDPAVVDGGSTVMYLPGKFMKSGAAINPDYPALPANALTHVLDMNGGPTTWRQTASMAFPRTQHNLTILPDGSILATGGSRNSNVFDESAAVFEAELWSPVTETWTTLAANQTPRLYHSTALLLPDGRVISAGGGRFGPSHLNGEFYSPPYLFKGPRPTITSAPSLIDYSSSFTVT
ncbi:MAG TPA: Ig-like domain-containing protein, partial [Candidatus Eisenbacteria bacterium]